jgi:TM2 domain-containing membrane protein YozV
MSTLLYCPHCGKQMSVSHANLGLIVACPYCRGQIDTGRVRRSPTSPPPPPNPPIRYYPPIRHPADDDRYDYFSSRNRVVAGLLGLLFGGFGVHRFYLGYHGIGLLQFFLLFPTCGTSAVWGFIEGILCLTGNINDVDGRPLRD